MRNQGTFTFADDAVSHYSMNAMFRDVEAKATQDARESSAFDITSRECV
jgi:hypothetical protein